MIPGAVKGSKACKPGAYQSLQVIMPASKMGKMHERIHVQIGEFAFVAMQTGDESGRLCVIG